MNILILVTFLLSALQPIPTSPPQYGGQSCRIWHADDGWNLDGVGLEYFLPHTTEKNLVNGSRVRCNDGNWLEISPPTLPPSPPRAPSRYPRWWRDYYASVEDGPVPPCWAYKTNQGYNLEGPGTRVPIKDGEGVPLEDGSVVQCLFSQWVQVAPPGSWPPLWWGNSPMRVSAAAAGSWSLLGA